jgi:hypothetical protein
MKEERQEPHEPGTVSTWFARAAKFIRQTVGAAPAMDVGERCRLLEDRDREETRWTAEVQRHDRRLAAAQHHVDEARQLLRDAEQHYAAADRDRLADLATHDTRIMRVEARLRAGASEHIEIFLRDVRDQLEALRARGVLAVHESWSRPNPVDGRRAHTVSSNLESVERRRVALMAAAAAAEAMELEALTEEQVIERLTALRDGIPEITPLTIVPGPFLTGAEEREIAWREHEAEAAR